VPAFSWRNIVKLIAEWRQSWRLWSVRVSAFGAAVFAFLLAAPDQALAIWNALPTEVKEHLPNQQELGLALLTAAAVARVLKQKEAGDGEPR
jgi:hypothetical protein